VRQECDDQMQRDETGDVKPFEGIEDDESRGTGESTGVNPLLSEGE